MKESTRGPLYTAMLRHFCTPENAVLAAILLVGLPLLHSQENKKVSGLFHSEIHSGTSVLQKLKFLKKKRKKNLQNAAK